MRFRHLREVDGISGQMRASITEDLQHDRLYGSVRSVNPLLPVR
ncbi:MAG TPA: hypothetical protein VHW09_08470 [Bryobacteraceae bacterium]|nr:hypothetical protein [Bryobacteraceae bacterium]